MIFGGVDHVKGRIFTTDPSGSYRSYKAVAIGIGRETAENVLKEEYRENLTLQETIKLAVKCLVKSLQARGEPIRIKIAVVPSDTKRFRQLSDEEIEKYLKDVMGSGT
jgi:20S proteasome alpha/beta subunit